jgi:hypothetical protein
MSEADKPGHRGRTWALSIVALLLVYVLSIGPVAYCKAQGWIASPNGTLMLQGGSPVFTTGYYPSLPTWLDTFYKPVHWMFGALPDRQPLSGYIGWWQRLAYGQ